MSEPACAASLPDVSLGCAPVAQLDRANASGALGREFESLRAHHSRSLSISYSISRRQEPWLPALCRFCCRGPLISMIPRFVLKQQGSILLASG
jgi:hypothetical protein